MAKAPVKEKRPPAKRGKYWKRWIENELSLTAWKMARDLYASLVLTDGYPLTDEQLDKIGRIYRSKEKIPAATFKKRIACWDRGRRPFLEDILKAMTEMVSNRIGENLVEVEADLLKRVVDKAREEGADFKDLVKALDKVSEYTGERLKKRLEIEDGQKRLPAAKEKSSEYLLAEVVKELDDDE